MKNRFPLSRVNWITSSFLIATLLTALIGTPIYIYHFGIDWFQIAMFLFYVPATAMSIPRLPPVVFPSRFPGQVAGEAGYLVVRRGSL